MTLALLPKANDPEATLKFIRIVSETVNLYIYVIFITQDKYTNSNIFSNTCPGVIKHILRPNDVRGSKCHLQYILKSSSKGLVRDHTFGIISLVNTD